MTNHERAVRKALKAFEPMVPPHVMTELTLVIEKYLGDVSNAMAADIDKIQKRVARKLWDQPPPAR